MNMFNTTAIDRYLKDFLKNLKYILQNLKKILKICFKSFNFKLNLMKTPNYNKYANVIYHRINPPWKLNISISCPEQLVLIIDDKLWASAIIIKQHRLQNMDSQIDSDVNIKLWDKFIIIYIYTNAIHI